MPMPKHISRLLLLMAVVAALGYAAKAYFTPESFYAYGPYRADSVAELAAQEAVFQTPRYCQSCHAERHAGWSANSHTSVGCEVGQQCTICHDPHAPKIAGAMVMVTGDAAAGAKSAPACAGCHGANGISPNDTWPNLAGQHAVYLARILGAYKSGAQMDVVMTPIAQSLNDADVQNLAAYYGGLSCKAEPVESAIGDAAAGKVLANNCTACHGETGIASNPAWPSIAGQQPAYLVNVLKAFRAGLRKDPMMAGIARSLSDADIADLAAYYAAQSCIPSTP
jgi:cytochrome c553